MSSKKLLILLGIGFAVLFHPTEASTFRRLNLEQIVSRAGRIFRGRCIETQVAIDRDLRQTVTFVTFVPDRTIRGGAASSGKITIELLGDQSASARPGESIEGIPRFTEGEEVVLFLYPPSAHGLTSPVGAGQGKFRIVHDKQGRVVAANQYANERLLDGLSPRAKAALGERGRRYHDAVAIPIDDLLEMARSLAATSVPAAAKEGR